MSKLDTKDIDQFEALFIRNGDVLDFSKAEFDKRTFECIGVELCKEYGLSKGKSLKNYFAEAKSEDCLKLINNLMSYYEAHYECEFTENTAQSPCSNSHPYNAFYCQKYVVCREILHQYNTIRSLSVQGLDKLVDGFSNDYLTKSIKYMVDIQEANPAEAIGKAKELIESCCKTILEDNHRGWDKDWKTKRISDEAFDVLGIAPLKMDKANPLAGAIKPLLGNLSQIAQRISELRNEYGSGHGKSASFEELEPIYAKLAVNASITLTTFLWELHERRKSP